MTASIPVGRWKRRYSRMCSGKAGTEQTWNSSNCQLVRQVIFIAPTNLEINFPAGDTTALTVHPAIPDAVRHVLDSGGSCGYGHSCGLPAAREAIARLYSPYTNDQNGVSPQVRVHVTQYRVCSKLQPALLFE